MQYGTFQFTNSGNKPYIILNAKKMLPHNIPKETD